MSFGETHVPTQPATVIGQSEVPCSCMALNIVSSVVNNGDVDALTWFQQLRIILSPPFLLCTRAVEDDNDEE